MEPNTNTTAASPNVTPTAGGFSSYMQKIEDFLATYLVQKAPAMPTNIKEGIVKYGPYVAIVLVILGLFLLIPLIFGSLFVATLSAAVGNSYGSLQIILGLVFMLPILVLEGLAIPGLMKQSKPKGWNLLFYAFLLDILYSIITLSIIGLVIRLLFLYVLFQIREYYR